MKKITTTYAITLDGKETIYTETREAYDIRDAHMMILYHWSGVDSIRFISDIEEV